MHNRHEPFGGGGRFFLGTPIVFTKADVFPPMLELYRVLAL
jgi:site-specific DNA-adenine methylase